MEGMQIKHKVLYAGRRKVLRVTSLATIESGPFIAADDPIWGATEPCAGD